MCDNRMQYCQLLLYKQSSRRDSIFFLNAIAKSFIWRRVTYDKFNHNKDIWNIIKFLFLWLFISHELNIKMDIIILKSSKWTNKYLIYLLFITYSFVAFFVFCFVLILIMIFPFISICLFLLQQSYSLLF